MRRIRIYNSLIDVMLLKEVIVVQTLSILVGSLALLLGALCWVLRG
jgi:hypothetical protein